MRLSAVHRWLLRLNKGDANETRSQRHVTLSPIKLDLPRIDRVSLTIAPLDFVSGALVRSGVSARVAGLANRPTVNVSGMLVFVNLPDLPAYDVEVDGRRAGFPFVERFRFTPPPAGTLDPASRRRDALLLPGPDYPFPPGTTLVRGVVTRGAAPATDASITAAGADYPVFATRSIANGAFALALRLPPLGTHAAEAPAAFTIAVSDSGGGRSFVRPLINGRVHNFREPIDLAGTNDPALVSS